MIDLYGNFTQQEAFALTTEQLMALPYDEVPRCRRRHVAYERYCQTVRRGTPPTILRDPKAAVAATAGRQIGGDAKMANGSARFQGNFVQNDGSVVEVYFSEYSHQMGAFAFVYSDEKAFGEFRQPLPMMMYFNG
jgi:hypothetical protein